MGAPRGFVCLLALLALLLATTGALADPPPRARLSATEELRRHFDQLIAMMKTPRFGALDADARGDAIARMNQSLFNWREMSRRALPSLDERTAAERRAFTAQFARLVEHAYLLNVDPRRAEHMVGEPVRYLGEQRDGADTVVRTLLVYLHDLPVDFAMRRAGRGWEVRDIWVKDVSVTDNYRAQFARVLTRDSFSELLGQMVAKTRAASDADFALAR